MATDLFSRFFGPAKMDEAALRRQHEIEKEAAAEKRRDAAESRRESERRWYARLPIIAIATLCVAVAAVTGMLVLASHYSSPPAKQDASNQPAPSSTETPASAPPKSPVKSSLSGKKLFEYNSSTLRVTDSAVQQELGRCQSLNPTAVHVVGHTDCIGSDEYNQDLSKRRAEAVKRYLTESGIDTRLITATGLGSKLSKADPLCASVVRATANNIARLEPYRRVDLTCDYEAKSS